jgi:hypothetical protein
MQRATANSKKRRNNIEIFAEINICGGHVMIISRQLQPRANRLTEALREKQKPLFSFVIKNNNSPSGYEWRTVIYEKGFNKWRSQRGAFYAERCGRAWKRFLLPRGTAQT